MPIDIDGLSFEELLDLNQRVVAQAHIEMMQFNLGQQVSFEHQGGRMLATLVKYNRKTVTVVTDNGQRWNISPHLLSPKRVFGLVIDFGTSQSPKSTRPLTTYLCPNRPGHQALRNNFASSLLLRTWLPYDWTPRSDAYFVFPLAQGTPGKQCGLAATGVYQPSLRSPWLAAGEGYR
ncbi:hypothetical protein, partial [Thiolapillus sp.]|uniref:hypothetical protein n=3 Tax=Thiolapillus sp. TaxID=2017437 RepID=UPI003AF4DDA8